MSAVIMTNVASLNSQRQLEKSKSLLNTSLERLSSGLRINSAKDDAAGLAISARMTSQISGMNVATRNANDGISLAQTAEGTLSAISDNLQRMRELAVQSSNASNSATDRIAIQQEVTALSAEIDRVASQTDFNGTKLLDGSFSAQNFQVGANVGQTITVSQIDSARTNTLGTYQGVQLSNQNIGTANDAAANQDIVVIDGTGTHTKSFNIANDAKVLASTINSSGIAGLTATAQATSVAAGTSADAPSAAGVSTLEINGLSISISGTTSLVNNRSAAVTAINQQSSVTGVIATDTGTGVSLAAADGRNITVDNFAAGDATDATIASYGLAAENTTGAKVDITYQAPVGAKSIAFNGAYTVAAQTVKATGTAIDAIDVKTQGGATTAIASIDAALASVNSSKASLGAIQNRFTSVVSNLQSSSENLSASRSRIQDADFAAETAAMSKANILQQAGTAMLAQANSAPQNVLSLLK